MEIWSHLFEIDNNIVLHEYKSSLLEVDYLFVYRIWNQRDCDFCVGRQRKYQMCERKSWMFDPFGLSEKVEK